jgi:hypothetical protein
VSRSHGVQRDNAGGDDILIVHIALRLALTVELGLIGKLAGIDELVAPEAVDAWPQRPDNTKDFGLSARGVDRHLAPDLPAGDQVLVNYGVDQEPSPHLVRCEKDAVACKDCCRWIENVARDHVDACRRVGLLITRHAISTLREACASARRRTQAGAAGPLSPHQTSA